MAIQFLNVPATVTQPDNTNIYTLNCPNSSHSDVTTAGFLNQQVILGHPFTENDVIGITNLDGFNLYTLSIDDNGVITLSTNILQNSGSQTILTGNFTVSTGVVTSGSSGHSGAFHAYPSVANSGYFSIESSSNTGNTVTVFKNAIMGQASTIYLSDPGTSNGYVPVSSVPASLTPADVIFTQQVAINASDLASSGHAVLYTPPSEPGIEIEVLDIRVLASPDNTGLSGGSGNRLLHITDGTMLYNNAGITAALLGTPVNTIWGGTGNPLPSGSPMSTTFSSTLYAQYSGGSADYTTGSVLLELRLRRAA